MVMFPSGSLSENSLDIHALNSQVSACDTFLLSLYLAPKLNASFALEDLTNAEKDYADSLEKISDAIL